MILFFGQVSVEVQVFARVFVLGVKWDSYTQYFRKVFFHVTDRHSTTDVASVWLHWIPNKLGLHGKYLPHFGVTLVSRGNLGDPCQVQNSK